jgi:hypothetical protein
VLAATVTSGPTNKVVMRGSGRRLTIAAATVVTRGTTLLDSGEVRLGAFPSHLVNRGMMTARPGAKVVGDVCCVDPSALHNFGTMTVAPSPVQPGPFQLDAVQLRNSGRLVITKADVAVNFLDAQQLAGVLELDDGSLRVSSARVVVSGGRVEGSGQLGRDVVNEATVSPGTAAAPFGSVSVQRTYAQTATGELIVDAAEPGRSDRVPVTGRLELAGRVRARVNGPHSLAVRRYPMFTYASQTSVPAFTVVRESPGRRPTFRIDLRPTAGDLVTRDLCASPGPARSLPEVADLLTCAEDRLPATAPPASLSLDRQLYYGAATWSRSQGRAAQFWPDVIPCTLALPDAGPGWARRS